MAQSTTLTSLRQAVIRYLQICENLGEQELVLESSTVRALEKLRHLSEPVVSQAPAITELPEKKLSVPSKAPGLSHLEGLGKAEALEMLRNEILSDKELPKFFRRAQNMVFGCGDIHAKLMFIGEAPGAEEDVKGEPFVGAAGQLLDKMIAAMGLERRDVYIGNVVKYRPDMPEGSRGNRKPTPEELALCRPYILKQISVIQPDVIVGLGATAMEGLLNQSRNTNAWGLADL